MRKIASPVFLIAQKMKTGRKLWSLMSQLKIDSEDLDSDCEDVVGVL